MTINEMTTKGERTRGEIVHAAHTLFLEKGYSGTSMRQIAARAGIALGGIYNHFDGKEDIFAAVFAERHPYLEVLPYLEQDIGSNLEDFLRAIATRMVQVLNERPDFLNLLFIEMIEFKGAHLPAFLDKILPRLQNFVTRFDTAAAATAVAARGKMRPLPASIILRSFLGMFISYAVSEHVMGILPMTLKGDALSYLIDIFLHGILQPESPTPPAQGDRAEVK